MTNPRVVFASHSAMGGLFRVGSHYYAEHFARHGDTVVHISSPVSALNFARVNDEPTRQRVKTAVRSAAPVGGVVNYVPFTAVPGVLAPPARQEWILRSAIPSVRKTLARAGVTAVDVLIIDQPLLASLRGLLPTQMVVYRPTDVYEGERAVIAQTALLKNVDAVVATSAVVLDSLRGQLAGHARTLVLPNGVDTGHFSLQGGVDRAGFVYVGALDHRIDWDSVGRLARALPTVPFDFFGAGARPGSMLPSNVHVKGPVPYQRLPSLLQQYRAGLLPFTSTSENAGRSPMKLYEFLACGLNILAINAPTVAQAGAPGVWTTTVADVALAQRALTAGVNTIGSQAATRHDWTVKAGELRRFLGLPITQS